MRQTDQWMTILSEARAVAIRRSARPCSRLTKTCQSASNNQYRGKIRSALVKTQNGNIRRSLGSTRRGCQPPRRMRQCQLAHTLICDYTKNNHHIKRVIKLSDGGNSIPNSCWLQHLYAQLETMTFQGTKASAQENCWLRYARTIAFVRPQC